MNVPIMAIHSGSVQIKYVKQGTNSGNGPLK